jgi:hypothetical protein
MYECSFVRFAGKTLYAGHIWFTLHNILQETCQTENWGKESNIESSIYIEQYRYFDESFQPYLNNVIVIIVLVLIDLDLFQMTLRDLSPND